VILDTYVNKNYLKFQSKRNPSSVVCCPRGRGGARARGAPWGHTREALTPHLAERGCGQAVECDDAHVARRLYRLDFGANPTHAVVVRRWQGKDDGPGGNTVFLTNTSVQLPLHPLDDADDRRLIEHCGIQEAKQQRDLVHF
jgi:hypothetical protein